MGLVEIAVAQHARRLDGSAGACPFGRKVNFFQAKTGLKFVVRNHMIFFDY